MTEIIVAFPPAPPMELRQVYGLSLRFPAPDPVVLSATGMRLSFPAPQAVTLNQVGALRLAFPAPQQVTLQAVGIQGPGGGGGAAATFETVARNLAAANAVITSGPDGIETITYANGVIKTFSYGPDGLAAITLSGATPGGINLTKTLLYASGELAGFSYS